MKFLTAILSIYILGLSFITCDDGATHDDASNEDEIACILKTDQHSDTGETDSCSPFCFCQCCHMNILNIDFYPYEIIPPELSNVPSTYFASSIQEVSHSFLHPPRV